MSAVKQPCKTGDKCRIGGSVINGACHNKAVCFLELGCKLVHNIVEHALAVFTAVSAGNTATDILVAYLHNFGLHALFRKDLFHFTHGNRGVAVYSRTAVDDKNFHFFSPPDISFAPEYALL